MKRPTAGVEAVAATSPTAPTILTNLTAPTTLTTPPAAAALTTLAAPGEATPPVNAPFRPSGAHHRHEALFVGALLRGAYDQAVAELRTAIYLRGLVGALFHGGLDDGHARFVTHLEGELASLLRLREAGCPHRYRISSGVFNSVKRLMYVPSWIRR